MNPLSKRQKSLIGIYLLVGIVAIISVTLKLRDMEAERLRSELEHSRAFVDSEATTRREAFKRLSEWEAKHPGQSSGFRENRSGVDAGRFKPRAVRPTQSRGNPGDP
jgi:hypothetical protein